MLEATLAELGTVGFEGLSIERVARKAGLNKTSVYRRWPTREALVAAALEAVAARLAPPTLQGNSLREELLALARGVAGLLKAPSGRALVRAGLAEESATEVALLSARGLSAGARTPGRAMAARARRRGEWRTGVDADQLVFTLVGALIHRAMLERAPVSTRWLSKLVDLLLDGAANRVK